MQSSFQRFYVFGCLKAASKYVTNKAKMEQKKSRELHYAKTEVK